jgi:hypothetical protein
MNLILSPPWLVPANIFGRQTLERKASSCETLKYYDNVATRKRKEEKRKKAQLSLMARRIHPFITHSSFCPVYAGNPIRNSCRSSQGLLAGLRPI